MSSSQLITMKPVGYVRTQAVGDEVKDKTRTSEIVIQPELMAALERHRGLLAFACAVLAA